MTTYTGPTPWDAEDRALGFASEDGPKNSDGDNVGPSGYTLFELGLLAEGYRLAKAEDAPLLEAARLGLASLKRQRSVDQEQQDFDAVAFLETAIVQAEGRTP